MDRHIAYHKPSSYNLHDKQTALQRWSHMPLSRNTIAVSLKLHQTLKKYATNLLKPLWVKFTRWDQDQYLFYGTTLPCLQGWIHLFCCLPRYLVFDLQRQCTSSGLSRYTSMIVGWNPNLKWGCYRSHIHYLVSTAPSRAILQHASSSFPWEMPYNVQPTWPGWELHKYFLRNYIHIIMYCHDGQY